MTLEEFTASLKRDGFPEPATVARPANEFVDVHTHPFEAKALILRGNIRLRLGEVETLYEVGDIFHLQPNEPHAEFYGPQGVEYLVGRK